VLHFLVVTKLNTNNRHPHIYGIDLASTSELIAFHRSPSEIAEQIGADQVIYQTIPDLVAACAELSPRDPSTQQFEVGVFTGKYITPVDDGYLEHIERVRGEKKKGAQKRQAVINVDAVEEGLKAATNGADLKRLKTAILSNVETTLESVNGTAVNGEAGETQDPSLHNLNDYKR
jgi:amidophosphoribosyltransferase